MNGFLSHDKPLSSPALEHLTERGSLALGVKPDGGRCFIDVKRSLPTENSAAGKLHQARSEVVSASRARFAYRYHD